MASKETLATSNNKDVLTSKDVEMASKKATDSIDVNGSFSECTVSTQLHDATKSFKQVFVVKEFNEMSSFFH